MKDIHLTPELIRAVIERRLSPQVLSTQLWRHLQAICPECRDGFEEWLAVRSGHDYSQVFDKLLGDAEAAPDRSEEEALARREFREILRTPAAKRETKIRNATKRFRSPFLAMRFLEENRAVIFDTPADAFEYATLARRVAERAEEGIGASLRVRAAIHQGNSLRVLGHFKEAEEYFEDARHLLANFDVVDGEVFAELDEYEGVFQRDRGHFSVAGEMLARAALTYQVLRDKHGSARTRIAVAQNYFHAAEPKKAITALYEALEHVEASGDESLEHSARHNLALYLCEVGDARGADKIFEPLRPFFARTQGRALKSRGEWVEALISRGLENTTDAEARLKKVIRSFLALGIGYEAALATLDLALLYFETGKFGRLKRLTKTLEAIFGADDLHREAVSALLLFEQAISREVVTETLLDRLRLYLRQARKNPGLKFVG